MDRILSLFLEFSPLHPAFMGQVHYTHKNLVGNLKTAASED